MEIARLATPQSYQNQVPVYGSASLHVFMERGQENEMQTLVLFLLHPPSFWQSVVQGFLEPEGLESFYWSSMNSSNEPICSLALYDIHDKDILQLN